MNVKRTRRLIFVTLLGIGIVTLITVLSNDPAPRQIGSQHDISINPEDLPPSLDQAPSAIPTPGIPAPAEELQTANLGGGSGLFVQRADPETGELAQEFTAQDVNPQRAGVLELTQPVIRFYLAPGRVLVMSADIANVVAPDNIPQSGTFKGNVHITYFQDPTERKPDLSDDSPHRRLKMKLDDATFDSTISQVTSESTVEVFTPTTKQIYFKGEGLTLRYDQLTGRYGRIAYIEVQRGDFLRYNPDALANAPTSSPPAGKAKTATGDPAVFAPPQFYSVTFNRDVSVADDRHTILADQLVTYFSIDADLDGSNPGVSALPRLPLLLPAHPHPVFNPLPFVVAQNTPATSFASLDDPDRMPETDSDIILRWKGPMVMQPLDELPVPMDQAGDLYARFDGAPITIDLEDGGRLETA
ncbi:MAG: hypothetical protein ACYTGQ_06045, partial [Planctomycetota bacterium]